MDGTIVANLANTSSAYPEKEAIVYSGARMTYGQLWNRVDSIASFLREEGIRPGQRVALLLINSPEYISAYYGVMAAGGVAVPFNTEQRFQDIVSLTEDCNPQWIVIDPEYREYHELLGSLGKDIGIISVGESGSIDPKLSRKSVLLRDIAEPSSASELLEIDPDSLAVIIYTSGTTGKPKGVMLSHRNIYSNTDSIQDYLNLDSSDKVMCVLPFHYSYGSSVLHTHLSVGASLVLENRLLYPHKIMQTIAEEKVTGFSGVPSTFNLLKKRVDMGQYNLPHLRYITQAGGPMLPEAIDEYIEWYPHVSFFVMYGQTEATARLSYLPPEMSSQKKGSIGRSIPGVQLQVRNSAGEAITEVGQKGEIWATGGNIMMGYWKDPDQTAKVLRDGWLRTGDIAYADSDGYLYITGRNSEMIKSGEHRIGPAEVENVIKRLDCIDEVAVVGTQDDILGQVLKAIIVLNPTRTIEVRDIKRHCMTMLPVYKIPKYIEYVDEIPKTSSGKIKRYLLQ